MSTTGAEANSLPTPMRGVPLHTATIQTTTADVAIVSVAGTEALLPVTEYLDGHRWRPGQKVTVILDRSSPKPVASTADDLVVVSAVEGLVPEVREGTVSIVGVARHAGVRTKVAVATSDIALDPVAALIGRGANRVRALAEILGGEKVDIVPWHPDLLTYARNALAPAKVESLTVVGADAIEAHTPSHQMAAAVGEGGLNSLLAGLLVGRSITVVAAGAAPQSMQPATPVAP